MRADTAAWAAIAAHLGFDRSSAPTGDGLLAAYREWKMLRALTLAPSAGGWRFDARFSGTGPNPSGSAAVMRVVGAIAPDGTIHIDSQEPSGPPPCPICLARGTKIATPRGEVAVEDIRPGDPVWTRDRLGQPVSAVVDQIGSMPVATGHEVVHLVLADGRAVLVSPGHPLLDGRPVAALRHGDAYDGSMSFRPTGSRTPAAEPSISFPPAGPASTTYPPSIPGPSPKPRGPRSAQFYGRPGRPARNECRRNAVTCRPGRPPARTLARRP